MPESKTDTRSRILAAAATAFGEQGYAGARVDDIAARAGVNKATVYYHVGGKETLYAAVIGEALDRALATLRSSIDEVDDPSERFRIIVRTLSATASSVPHFAPLMLREVASGGASLPDDVLVKMASLLGIVAEVLGQGVEEGEFRAGDPIVTHMTVAGATFFLMAGTPLRQRMRELVGEKAARMKEPAPGEIADVVATLILDGLRGREPNTQKRRGKGKRS